MFEHLSGDDTITTWLGFGLELREFVRYHRSHSKRLDTGQVCTAKGHQTRQIGEPHDAVWRPSAYTTRVRCLTCLTHAFKSFRWFFLIRLHFCPYCGVTLGHLRELVSINADVVVLVLQDLGILGVIQGQGQSQGNDGGESNDGLHFEFCLGWFERADNWI